MGNMKTVLLFTALFVGSTFVNKYVLSVLKFQFPTIFQGWQTLVGFVVLRALTIPGKIDLSTSQINWKLLSSWLPAMMLYVGSIYSASIALSQLTVATFLCVHGLTNLFTAAADLYIQGKPVSISRYSSLMLILSSSIMICLTDPQFSQLGYRWMTVHVLTAGGYNAYQKVMKRHLELRPLQRMYCNYLYSVIVLTPSSYFLGEALMSQQFPLWYYSKFYIGCIFSGVLGVFLNLLLVWLENGKSAVTSTSVPCVTSLSSSDLTSVSADQQIALGKIVASLLSMLVFEITLTSSYLMWILVNLVTGLVYASCSDAESSKESSCDYDTHMSVGAVATETLHQTEQKDGEHNHNT